MSSYKVTIFFSLTHKSCLLNVGISLSNKLGVFLKINEKRNISELVEGMILHCCHVDNLEASKYLKLMRKLKTLPLLHRGLETDGETENWEAILRVMWEATGANENTRLCDAVFLVILHPTTVKREYGNIFLMDKENSGIIRGQ